MLKYIVLLLFIIILYLVFTNMKCSVISEGFIDSNQDNLKNDILNIYQMDLPAIKNMVSIASALNDKNQLTIPTHLLVEGSVETSKNLNIDGFASSLGDLYSKNIKTKTVVNSNTGINPNPLITTVNTIATNNINVKNNITASKVNANNITGNLIYINDDMEDIETKCKNLVNKYTKLATTLSKVISNDNKDALIYVDSEKKVTMKPNINTNTLESDKLNIAKSNTKNLQSNKANVGDYLMYNNLDNSGNSLVIGEKVGNKIIPTFNLDVKSKTPLIFHLPINNNNYPLDTIVDNSISSTYTKQDNTTGYNTLININPKENPTDYIPTNPTERKLNINYNTKDKFNNNILI